MKPIRTCARALRHLLAFTAIVPVSAASLAAQMDADSPAYDQSPEIITVVSRVPQRIDQVGSAASVFTLEQIELQDLRVLDDVLNRVPGVAVTRSGGFGQNTQVRMRGFTTKHTLVLVDGVRVNNPSEFSSQFGIQHVMLDMIERVEVLRGPQSGIYGADAVAGVIALTTRRGTGEPDFRLTGGYGTHDTLQLGMGSQGAIGQLGYAASASYVETDGISIASRPPGNVEPDGYRNTTLSLNIDYAFTPDFDFRGGVRYVQAVNQTDNGFLMGDPVLPDFLFQDSAGHVDNDQLVAHGGFSLAQLDGRLTHNVQLAHTRIESLSEAPASAVESVGEVTELQYFASYTFGEAGTLFGPESFVLLGMDATRESALYRNVRGAQFAAIDRSIDNVGIYTNLNWQLRDELFLSISARHDDNADFGGVQTGRVAISYGLPDSLTGAWGVRLRSSLGSGREAPSLRQLFGQSATFQGNPDLATEETWMADAGVDFTSPGGNYRFGVTAYYGEADNGIFSVFNPALGVSQPQNISSVIEMDGVELELSATLTRWLDANITYTNARSVQVSNGQQLFGRPEHEFSFALTARATDQLSVTFDGYARSEFLSDYPSTFEMPGFELFNLSGRYELNDNVMLQASVKNIFDTRYEYKLGDGTYGRTLDFRISLRY